MKDWNLFPYTFQNPSAIILDPTKHYFSSSTQQFRNLETGTRLSFLFPKKLYQFPQHPKHAP